MATVGTFNLWQEEWLLYEKVEFDGIRKLIQIHPEITDITVRSDIYSAWKRWVRLQNNAAFQPALRVTGGDPLGGGQFSGDIYFLLNGWKVVIQGAVTVNGILYDEAGASPYIVLPGGGVVATVSSLTQTIETGSGGAGSDVSAIWGAQHFTNQTVGSFGAAIRDLFLRLPEVEAAVNQTRTNVTATRTDVAGVKTDVAGVKADVANLDNDVGAVATTVGGVSTAIVAIDADIAALDTKVTGVATGVTSVETKVDTATTNIAAVNTAVGTVSTNLSAVDTKIDAIGTDIDGVVTSVASNSTKIDAIGTDIDGVVTSVASNSTKVDGLVTDITALGTAIDSDNTALTAAITAVDGKVTAVQTSVDAVDGKVTAAATEITGIQTDVTSVLSNLGVATDLINTLLKFERNRTRVDQAARTLTVYDDDGVTPLKVFNLRNFLGQPSVSEVAERSPQ